jgi:hypothetical protein
MCRLKSKRSPVDSSVNALGRYALSQNCPKFGCRKEKGLGESPKPLKLGGRYWDRTSDPCRVKAGNIDFSRHR